MSLEDKLSDDEFRQMFRLLHRYASTEMDQWDNFKFDYNYGKVFVSISLSAGGHEDAFVDVSHLVRPEA